MAFALSPDIGPPRLIRFHHYLAEKGMVAKLDKKNNVLHVGYHQYKTLAQSVQEMVLRTHEEETWPSDLPKVYPEE